MARFITEDKIIEIGRYTVNHYSTVRQTAAQFDIPKTNVHIALTRRLPDIDPDLYEKVAKIIKVNKEECHIRGGLATKRKYEMLRAEKLPRPQT